MAKSTGNHWNPMIPGHGFHRVPRGFSRKSSDALKRSKDGRELPRILKDFWDFDDFRGNYGIFDDFLRILKKFQKFPRYFRDFR